MAGLATVQTLCSLTHQIHELHRLDRISVSHQVNLSTQFTSLYFVMVLQHSFRRLVGVSSNVHHLAHVLAAFNKYFHFTKNSIVSPHG